MPLRTEGLEILVESDWLARCAAHKARVEPWTAPRLARMSNGERHPVDDFLFDYYSFRPAQLHRWHPGLGRALAGSAADCYLAQKHYANLGDGIGVTVEDLKPARYTFVRWLLDLLEVVQDRPPAFGCAGLHEWAMVYRAGEIRHSRWPLRLSGDGVALVVESLPIRCSHYDAFRFFTPEARPLNHLLPTRAEAQTFEQSGCLHANMDLYKWAYKLVPFASSDLVADAFAFARAIREVDMRASPYDLAALGITPIPIETVAGRAEYENLQRAFADRGRPLRARLIDVCRGVLAADHRIS
jgi:hypothetical protein